MAEGNLPLIESGWVVRRRPMIVLGAASLARLLLGAPAIAFERDPGPVAATAQLVTPDAQRAIERGLEFLAQRQGDDGSFGGGGYGRNVAICALAGTAFLSQGSTPDRGQYGRHVSRCVAYLLKNSQESGLIDAPGSGGQGPMYAHGFATLFLAETYGMSREPEVRRRLAKAVELIISTQNHEGGWRYQAARQEADVSVTVCQVMALRAARNAGLFVPRDTIDRSVAYLKKCQNADGGFLYRLPSGESAFPRSAAGVVALQGAGIYEGPEIDRGLAYLRDFLPNGDVSAYNREGHFFYGHYYAAQAMWHAGGRHWMQWYPAIRDELLARQRNDDGAWTDPICQEYGTAMACIILQMPNDYLPIFQR
ncbi:MAG TPA: prenyltransferase/squalene oxidase repeat-containing protein [Pirellulales bacterium]|nr:prenyltransferase/squalene oxidase repeat-containing protein [Pirellulales bacterium]